MLRSITQPPEGRRAASLRSGSEPSSLSVREQTTSHLPTPDNAPMCGLFSA